MARGGERAERRGRVRGGGGAGAGAAPAGPRAAAALLRAALQRRLQVPGTDPTLCQNTTIKLVLTIVDDEYPIVVTVLSPFNIFANNLLFEAKRG